MTDDKMHRHRGTRRDRPPEDSPAAPKPAEPEPKPDREAAKYRRQLRDTEAERDTLAGKVEAMQRREVERQVAEHLSNPEDFWLTGRRACRAARRRGQRRPGQGLGRCGFRGRGPAGLATTRPGARLRRWRTRVGPEGRPPCRKSSKAVADEHKSV